MYPPRTPTKSHDSTVNSLIRNLSIKWSLGLPIRDTVWSPAKIPNPDAPQEKILTRLRFLYFKDATALHGVIASFEEWARPVVSNWKWKPQQERGTIPTSSGANVFKKDSFLKTSEVPESAVASLIIYLSKLLEDEVYLVKARMESNQSPPANNVDQPGDDGEAASPEKRPLTRVSMAKSPKKRQTTLDFRKVVPQEQSGLAANSHASPRSNRPESVQPFQDQRASAASGHPSSDEFLPSSGWLGQAEYLSRLQSDSGNSVPSETRPNTTVDQAMKGPRKDTEVFDVLPDSSRPPSSVWRDNNDFHSISTDNSNEATDNIFIKMFDAVYISHPSQSKKRSSDTTEEAPARKAQCNSKPPTLPETMKVSTYVPAPHALKRALKDTYSVATSAATSATTSFKESFDSEVSFVESHASQFSVGSQLTQLTEPDNCDPFHVPDMEKVQSMREQANTKCADTADLEVICKTGFNDMPKRLLTTTFRARYEISRFATRCNIPIADIPLPEDLNNYDKLWQCLAASARERNIPPPERCDPETWVEAGRNFENVTLTGDLQFCSRKESSIFELQLKPMKTEMSRRLFRRFGNDRFLVIGLPSLEEKHFPKHLQKDGQALRKRIIAALIEQEHRYFGRIWKAFYVKEKGDKKKKVTDNQSGEVKHLAYFFAVNGCDFRSPGEIPPSKNEPINSHSPMDISDLWDWFCPREQNKHMTYCKMFSRMALGLSRTIPTLVFSPSQIRRIPDVLAEVPTSTLRGPKEERKVMNDGCARISRVAAQAIAEMLGIDSKVPSAFQGRIGGAKGLWMVDVEEEYFNPRLSREQEFWIEISESQEKFKPHPVDFTAPDPDRITFEVHAWSKPLTSAVLNFQLLPILESQGVPRSNLAKLLQEDLTFQIAQQKVSMDDAVTFRKWNHDLNAATDERARVGGVRRLGSLPDLSSERINLLLDSGFHPKTCLFLKNLAWDATSRNCERLKQKLNIGVGQSAYAFITCDPLKVLEEGEVHLGFSKTFFDPKTKFQDTMLHGIDVLVARLPALLPSDIQRVKAVFKPELRRLKDIVVFPAKGASPLAETLSGGDYDGDRVWICWDPSIVNNFSNSSVPSNPPNLAALGLTRDTTTVAQLASRTDPMGAFLQKAFDFCLEPNLLGLCTNFHERMCYARKDINTRGAVIMSTLLGHLVDREKQGIRFTDEDWTRLRQTKDEIWPKNPPNPAYKDRSERPTSHIIDHLVFNVAITICEETLHDFSETLKDAVAWDSDLTLLYNQECNDAAKDREVKHVLDQLKADLETTHDHWSKGVSASDDDRAKEGRFPALVEETYSRFRQILPPANSTHPLISHWRRDAERNSDDGTGTVSHWSLLRASATFARYYNCGSGKFPWYMAGRELGILKAGRAPKGKWRAVVEPVYAGLKPDAGYVKRVGRRRELEELFGDGEDVGL